MQQTFKLPCLPPSSNASHRVIRGMLILSKEAREFRKLVMLEAIAQRIQLHQGKVEITLKASYGRFKNGNAKPGDVTNLIKQMQDSLNTIAWHDDKQIWKATIERVDSPQRQLELIIKDLP